MKSLLPGCLAIVGVLVTAACSHIDLAPSGDPNRVVSGSVSFNRTVPAGAELVVRIVDTSGGQTDRPIVDVPVSDLRKPLRVERVLGEHVQTLVAGAREPVPFRLEFQAEDAVLRRGLNLEARVSYGGRVHFRTLSAHVVTLASSRYPHELLVESIDR